MLNNIKMKKYLIIAIVLFASCKPSKTIIKENTIVKYDTIHTSDVIYKTRAIRDSIIIENPCDSLGILTDFYSKFVIPQGTITLRSTQGRIEAKIDIDSIESVYKSKYQLSKSDNSKVSIKEVVKNVVPMWAIITIFFESVIIIGYVFYKTRLIIF
jgi:hypothetical protein